MTSRTTVFLLLATLLVGGPTLAQNFEPPADTEFDWLQLTSDEWLKGEIVSMYEELLVFDSDNLGELEIDWADVQQLRSAGVVQIGFADRDRDAVTGVLTLAEDTVTIEGDTTVEFPREEMLTLISGPPREANYWTSNMTLGANFRSGNVDQTVFNAWARALRRTPKNRIGLEYLGNYNETDSLETNNNHRVNGSWDRFVSERFFFTPINFEWYKDPFLNIDQRWTVGVGLGYVLIDSSRAYWSIQGGPGYQYIEFDEVEPGTDRSVDSFALMGGTLFTYEITGNIDYRFDYRFSFLDEEAGSYTHHLVTGFTIEITDLIDLDLGWVWDRVQDPTPDSDGILPKQNDYQTIIGVGLSF